MCIRDSADTVLRWPFAGDARPRLTALIAPLAFAFSPLVLVWSRTAVSDALLCGLLGLSLLLQWRRFAAPQEVAWWPAWVSSDSPCWPRGLSLWCCLVLLC